MMNVYFLVQAKVNNEVEYKKYLEKCDDVFSKYKGKYLAVDENYLQIEGSSDSSRIILIEFQCESDYDEWYNSKDYQEIVKYRLNGAICNSVLIHGK